MTKLQENAVNSKSTSLLPPDSSKALDKSVLVGTDFDKSLKSVTSVADCKVLKKRAMRKWWTTQLVPNLVNASKLNPKSTLQKQYWNAWHCCDNVIQKADGTVVSKYCKTRMCMVCNAIRTAQYIDTYQPIIDEWENPQMVTLTDVNVSEADLAGEVDSFVKDFAKINEVNKKRAQRGTAKRFKAIRKLECTYSVPRNDYNPHFHILVNTKEAAEFIRKQWLLKRNANRPTNGRKKADPTPQNIKDASGKGALQETFKYMTKVVSPGKNKGARVIQAYSLDVIFNAIKGRRTVQNYGFKIPNDPDIIDDETVIEESEVVALFTWVDEDWVDINTGELLSGNVIPENMKEVFKNVIRKPPDT